MVHGIGLCNYYALEKQFIRVGYEIEEGLEVRFILSFVQFVIEGALFGIGFILFFLFDEEFGGEDFAAEVAVIECRVIDPFVEDL